MPKPHLVAVPRVLSLPRAPWPFSGSILVWVLNALMASAAEPPPSSPNPGPTCVVLTREGKVELSLKGATVWTAVQTNQLLHIGDRLRTGFHSRTTLRWS